MLLEVQSLDGSYLRQHVEESEQPMNQITTSPNAIQALNHLASMPDFGSTTVEKADLKAIMLQTGGTMMARGLLYDIVSKHLGAGVYKLSLKLSNP